MVKADIKQELLAVVDACLKQGPGFAQDCVVLREAAEKLCPNNLSEQQELLTCWHNLFLDGTLAWGYDLDTPGAPFFHRTGKTSQSSMQ